MTGRYKAYPEYKDSGVEWLGNVPLHWKLSRLGGMFDERSEKVSDKDFSALSVTKDGIVPQLDNAAKTDSGDNRKKVCVDDFVINSRSDRKGSSGTSKLNGSVSLISIVLSPTGIYPDFAHHLLRSYPFQNEFYRYGKGIHADLWSTNYSEMKNIILAMPDDREQQKIANFLDHETAKIDTLIAKQEKLIELLKEKRQAVISHAVTKGLNPNAPMRDSGVEWLGEVPEHWVVCAIKRELSSLDYRRIPLSADERGKRSGGYRYYGASGVIDHIDDYIFDEPTVLVGEDGANLVNRSTPLAFAAYGQYWVNNHAHILSPKDGLAEYWAEVIEIIDVTPLISGSAQPKLTAEALGNLKIAFPPFLEERETINSFIRSQKTTFDSLIGKAQLQVKLLKERKTALISAAVTGKIDVRDFVSEQGQSQGV